jgi:hypothetical protein
MAPTGEAAHNAGGTTVHHSLGVAVKGKMVAGLTEAKAKALKFALQNLVCLIVDERGLLSNEVIAKAEYNVRNTAYKGINENLPWGNIHIVILIGDDYQLPLVKVGACSAFAKDVKLKTEEDNVGKDIFLAMGQMVMVL